MTFIPPKTFAVGEVLSAVDMNVFVRDNTANLDERIFQITNGEFSFRFVGRRVITSNQTVVFDDLFGDGTDTSFVRALRFIVQGGGGGGAGSGTTLKVGGGGGAGATIEEFRTSLGAYKPNFTAVVGPAGSGGVTESSGSSGGNSSVPGIFAPGGGAGVISTISQAVDMRAGQGGVGGSAGGAAASATPGSYRIATNGENGLSGLSIVTSSDATGIQLGGNGGNTRFGRGGLPGRGKSGGTANNGSAGSGFGTGGGGAVENGIGGNGAPGLIIIDMFQ